MIETHDLFLRALAIPVAKKKKKKKIKDAEDGDGFAADEPKWPDTVFVFDTESRTTVDQSLTFGVWRRCKLVEGVYEVIEEGIFYSDDLPTRDLNILKAYMDTAISDVRSFPLSSLPALQVYGERVLACTEAGGSDGCGLQSGLRSHANRARLERRKQGRMVAHYGKVR